MCVYMLYIYIYIYMCIYIYICIYTHYSLRAAICSDTPDRDDHRLFVQGEIKHGTHDNFPHLHVLLFETPGRSQCFLLFEYHSRLHQRYSTQLSNKHDAAHRSGAAQASRTAPKARPCSAAHQETTKLNLIYPYDDLIQSYMIKGV